MFLFSEKYLLENLALKKALPELVDSLEAKDAADFLYSKYAITKLEWEDIVTERNRSKGARSLIEYVRGKNMDVRAFEHLAEFIQTKQGDLYQVVMETYNNITDGKLTTVFPLKQFDLDK